MSLTDQLHTPLFRSTEDLERSVRSNDPDPSWVAAAIAPDEKSAVRDYIVLFLARKPASTDDEIFAAYHQSGGRRTPQRVRTARQELSSPKTGDPLIETAGIGASASGGPARTWKLVGA